MFQIHLLWAVWKVFKTHILMDHVLQHPQLPVSPLCVHRRLERPRNLLDCHLDMFPIRIVLVQ